MFFAGNALLLDKTIFNYRSRTRRIVENAFRIMSARWHILRQPIEAKPEQVDGIVKACVALHNYLKSTNSTLPPNVRYVISHFVDYEDEVCEIRPGEWHRDAGGACFEDTGRLATNTASRNAMHIQDHFKTYFLTEDGQVPWQNAVTERGSD
ncbi:UNVERIFIED_CONTAM: hypothetical protein FKN15_044283 [Acipenser sinensis]